MAEPSDITLRPLETRDECEACVRLQRDTWGPDFLDVVPATILMVSQRVGGVAVGAFDVNHRLLGFVFGISGVRNGQLAHWSDMLAVRPEARRAGLGRRLKLYQRELLLERGINVAYWSFDPLVARNANLNVNGLGAMPVEYVVNMYGDTGSTLHRGLDTDRFVVEWRLADPTVESILSGERPVLPSEADRAPIVNPDTPTGAPPHVRSPELEDSPWVRIAVPRDIDNLKEANPDDARLWQMATRQAFPRYLSDGYTVAGFAHDESAEQAWYVLTNRREEG